MKHLTTTLNTKQEIIYIYDQHFTFPNDPFTFYWVAKKENGDVGFLIDGKRLCFKHAFKQEWEDIMFFQIDDQWLDLLRSKSDKNRTEKPTIVINVSGGYVTGVVSDSPIDVNVIIRDFDDIKAGDDDPIKDETQFDYELL